MSRLPKPLRHPTLWTSLASVVALVLLIPLLVAPGFADTPTGTRHIDGSGTATMPAEVDPGDTVEACTFSLAVEASVDEAAPSGPASGTFTCSISQDAIDLGIPFSAIDATITNFTDLADSGSGALGVVVYGTGDVTAADGSIQQAPVGVRLIEGSAPGAGDPATLRVFLGGIFDGMPGDREAGNDRYDMAEQTVTDGSVEISYEAAPSPTPTPSESPSPSPTPSPSPSPTPTPSPSPSPSPSPRPSPTPTTPLPPPNPGGGAPPPTPPTIGPPPYNTTGPWSTAKLMATLAALSPTGQPQMSDILRVVGPFPVAGLASWTDDWHAYRCCPTPHLHEGLDMMAAKGTPVVAAADGYVSEIIDHPDSSGQAVQINDPSTNTQYWYMHLSAYAPALHVGEAVHVGQVLGYVGDTGNPLPGAYHLHFEVRPNGVPVPPLPYVNAWLAEAQLKAYQLAGPGYYTEETFPYAITSQELQLWMDQAAALIHDTSGEGELLDPASAAPTPTGTPAPTLAGGMSPASSATPSKSAQGGLLAAILLLVFLVLPGIVGGRRQARAARAAVAARIGARDPAPAGETTAPARPGDTSTDGPRAAGGSAAVAAR